MAPSSPRRGGNIETRFLAALALLMLVGCGSEAREGAPDTAAGAPLSASADVGEAPPAARDRSVTILFTTGRRGQLEESGCRRDPLGGLARMATWLATDPLAGEPDKRLLLDGGDTFLPSPPRPPTDDHRAAAALVADVYDELGYDVVARAPRDLDLGVEALREINASHRYAISTANLFQTGTDRPPFHQGMLFSVDDVRVGVLGVLDAAYGDAEELPEGAQWRYRPPLRVTRDQVARLRDKGADVVVVLGQLRDEELERVARIPGVDFVLQGSGPEDAQPLRQVRDKAWVIYPAGRGENVAVLQLTLPASAKPPYAFVDGNEAERIAEELARLNDRIARLEAKRRPGNSELIAKTRAQRSLLALDAEKVAAPPAGLPTLRYHLAPIRLDIAEEPEIARRVDAEIERARAARLPPTDGEPPTLEQP